LKPLRLADHLQVRWWRLGRDRHAGRASIALVHWLVPDLEVIVYADPDLRERKLEVKVRR